MALYILNTNFWVCELNREVILYIINISKIHYLSRPRIFLLKCLEYIKTTLPFSDNDHLSSNIDRPTEYVSQNEGSLGKEIEIFKTA